MLRAGIAFKRNDDPHRTCLTCLTRESHNFQPGTRGIQQRYTAAASLKLGYDLAGSYFQDLIQVPCRAHRPGHQIERVQPPRLNLSPRMRYHLAIKKLGLFDHDGRLCGKCFCQMVKQVRRIVERALRDFREDAEQFGAAT